MFDNLFRISSQDDLFLFGYPCRFSLSDISAVHFFPHEHDSELMIEFRDHAHVWIISSESKKMKYRDCAKNTYTDEEALSLLVYIRK